MDLTRRALVSAHDKAGLAQFVAVLSRLGFEIVSSGGTARSLREDGFDVVDIEEVTGFPEILGGRVKTLHPRVHGGILARGEEDDPELAAHGIERFGVVVCNLYPFRETLAAGSTREELISQIDIGGPAMIRAAAKSHDRVVVVTDPSQYDAVAAELEAGGPDLAARVELAAEAFALTASYDAAITRWLGGPTTLTLRRAEELRYGENPHQGAGLYAMEGSQPWWGMATQHQGRAMSFNNYADADAAWRLVADLGEGSVAVIKHTNPSGAATGAGSVAEAFLKAWEGDDLAAFGSVVAINGELDAETAELLAGRYVEVVLACSASDGALAVTRPRNKMRVVTAPRYRRSGLDYRGIDGGFLVQEPDGLELGGWDTVSARSPNGQERNALELAWVVAAHTKSNAVVIANEHQVVGVGAGDQSRVGAARRAVAQAGDRAKGAAAASDAYFPFRDGLDTLAEAGVVAVAEPGGSIRDDEVIAAADSHGLALVFTGRRHFRH